jgi:hypothetical protein
MGYDPNDPNLVDEPDLDVENPYEGLGPGRPDPVSRVLMPTAGRQSPDSIGHGNTRFSCCCCCVPAYAFPNPFFQLLLVMVKNMGHSVVCMLHMV